MTRRRSTLALVGSALLLPSLALAGCSGDDEPPAVCAAVDSLKTSVTDLKDLTIDQDTLTTLQGSLDQIQEDLSEVRKDAQAEYGEEVDAVDQAASSVGQSLDAAVATPSVSTVTAVGTAIQELGSSLTALEDAVASTC